MKLTLPISQLITKKNISEFDDIADVYLLNGHNQVFIRNDRKELIHHVSEPILDVQESIFYNATARNNYCSCHLGMAVQGVKLKDYHYDSDQRWEPKKIKEEIANKVKQFRDIGIKKISLENTNYYDYLPYSYVCESGFIREVIEENDVGFCFDIAHAIITAWNMKINLSRYIDKLPFDKITEIHLSGHGFVKDEARDLHEKPDHVQMNILDKLNERFDLKECYLVVEYYKCFDTLCEIYKQLKERY